MILRLIVGAVAILTSTIAIAQDGIDFKDISFEEALEMAKSERKVVFIDGFASWCGPCKRMDKITFKDQKVGAYYNDQFVSLKLDMEKEGKMVAKKYNVAAYPTFLYLDSEGRVLHKGAGFFEPEEFISLAEESADETNRLGTLQTRFETGDRNPDMLRMLLEHKFELQDPSYIEQVEAIANLYDDWNTEEVRRLIFEYTNTAISPLYRHMVENRKDYETQFGRGAVWNKVETLLRDRSFEIDKTSISEMADLFKLVFPKDGEKLASKYRMSFYRQKGDRQNYADSAIDHFAKYPSKDALELNEVGVTFSKVVDDVALLKEALALVDASIDLEDAHYNNDTRAALLFKLGDLSSAKAAAQKAINLAKVEGEDASYTEELLAVILSHESQ